MFQLRILPCLDSDELAAQRRSELALRPELAESLGRSAVEAIELGYYLTDNGKVDWSDAVRAACESKVSIAPEAELPTCGTVAILQRRLCKLPTRLRWVRRDGWWMRGNGRWR